MDDEGYMGTMQYWSENHQIGWIQAMYLIGKEFGLRVPFREDRIIKCRPRVC